MSKMTVSFVGVIAGCLLSPTADLRAADKTPDLSKLPPPAKIAGVTFDQHIRKIVEVSCLKCHSGDRPKGRYVMSTREAFIKGGDSGKPAVVPGKSDQSPAVIYVADLVLDMEMPPLDKRDQYPGLTKEEIGLLRAWIDQGAK